MVTRAKKRREEKRVSTRKRAETHKTGFERTTLNVSDDIQFLSITKAGTKRIDVLPYRVGDGNPYAEAGELFPERTFFTHRDIGVDQGSFVCPAKTAKKPCPICDYRAELQRDPDSDSKLIKSLTPKERQLWNVIDLEERDKGVQIWDVSFHLFGKRLDAEIRNADEDDNYEFFSDLKDGQTLKLGIVQKSIEGGKPFCDVDTIGFKSRRKPYDESILDEVHNLDEILAILDYDKLKAIFLQTESDDESKDDEKESKPKTGKKEKPATEEKTAKDAGLKKGMSVEHEDYGICDIARISADGTSLTLEDKDNDIHRPVGVDEVTIHQDEPAEKEAPFDEDEPEKADKKSKKEVEEDEDDDENWDDDFDDNDDEEDDE